MCREGPLGRAGRLVEVVEVEGGAVQDNTSIVVVWSTTEVESGARGLRFVMHEYGRSRELTAATT